MASEKHTAPHTGVVIQIDGDEATLRFERGKMCANCGACLSAGPTKMEMTLPNTIGAEVGDRVTVELNGGQVAGASMIAYLIPLVLLILGVWIGSRFSDVLGLACGLGGCTVSFFILRLVNRAIKRRNAFRPVMRAVADTETTENILEQIEK